MKSPSELEKIAREIADAGFHTVESYDLKYSTYTVKSDQLVSEITEALTRIQDEALASVLPSLESAIDHVAKNEAEGSTCSDALDDMYNFLRANMKPAPEWTEPGPGIRMTPEDTKLFVETLEGNPAPQMPTVGRPDWFEGLEPEFLDKGWRTLQVVYSQASDILKAGRIADAIQFSVGIATRDLRNKIRDLEAGMRRADLKLLDCIVSKVEDAPQPQRLSDEELLVIARDIRDSDDIAEDLENKSYRAAVKRAAIMGYRAAEERLLGKGEK